MENGGRLFIVRGALPHPALAALVIEALPSMLRLLDRRPVVAFIGSVRRSVARGGISSAQAHLVLTFEEWEARRAGRPHFPVRG
jgi:hypothetical protein